jgi:hypothetical protein
VAEKEEIMSDVLIEENAVEAPIETPVVVPVVDYKIEEGMFKLTVDPNKNGKPLLFLQISLAEIPSEVIDIFKK